MKTTDRQSTWKADRINQRIETSDLDPGIAPKISHDRPEIELRGVSKLFPSISHDSPDVLALSEISLAVFPGEFVSIVGPSGCGKSTLFNIISGLDEPTSGEVVVAGDPKAKRLGRIGYMHQKDLLLPWRTVLDNVTLGLEIQGYSRAEQKERAMEQLRAFGLADFANLYPSALSGGMRQRVAFSRTLLLESELLLLDEPFGALDALTRSEMQEWLAQVCEDLRPTVLFITHDPEEAILLSDRVYALSPRPGHVRSELRIDLPRPRDFHILGEIEYNTLKRDLISILRSPSGSRASPDRTRG